MFFVDANSAAESISSSFTQPIQRIESHVFLIKIPQSTRNVCVAGVTLEQDGSLIIERVKKDDEGRYECVAQNTEGITNTSALVTVLGESVSAE